MKRWAASARRATLIALGLLGSGVLVLLAFFQPKWSAGDLRLIARFDVAAWARELPSHLSWVVPYVVLTAALPLTRAAVWLRTLPDEPPGSPTPTWGACVHALALGGLAQNLVPGRLGVLASAWVLSRRSGAKIAALLSSLLLAKLLELGALLGATTVVASIAWMRGVAGGWVTTLLAAGLIALGVFSVAVLAVRRFAPRLAARLEARKRFLRAASLLVALAAGLKAVGSPGRLWIGLLSAFAPVMISLVAYATALRHIGVATPLVGGGVVLAAVTLGQLTPGLPIGTGVYYFVCSWAARSLGVPAADAAALAVLSHAANVATHLAVGLIAAIADPTPLRDLARLRRRQRAPARA